MIHQEFQPRGVQEVAWHLALQDEPGAALARGQAAGRHVGEGQALLVAVSEGGARGATEKLAQGLGGLLQLVAQEGILCLTEFLAMVSVPDGSSFSSFWDQRKLCTAFSS